MYDNKPKTINHKPRHSTDTVQTEYRTLNDRLIELCLIFLIVFTPLAYGSVHSWSIAVLEVTAALMAIFWIFKMLRNGILDFVRTPIDILVLLFIFYVSLQLFFSSNSLLATRYSLLDSIYPWATKTELLKFIAYALIFFITLNTIKTRRQITRFLSVIIAMGFIMSIFYLMRYFGARVPRGIINSDHFSSYLGMIIPLTLGFLFVRANQVSSIEHRASSIEYRVLLFFTIIIMGVTLFFTMSRGGMFSLIGALLFMAILVLGRKSIKRKGWILSAVAIFIILTITWLGATPVVERILSVKAEITSLYFSGRLPIWQGTLNIIKDYPIFGTGLGTFNYIFPKYQPVEIMSKHYTYAHSDILELFSETGIVGFLLPASCFLLLAIYLFRCFNQRHDPWVIGMSIGLFGALVSIFIHSFADFNLHIPANAILLTLILALTLIILNLKRDRFGERVVFKKMYFRVSRIPLYLLTIIVFSFYSFLCLTPALADYYFGNKQDDAIGNTQNAIKLDPTDAKYHYHLGKFYSKSEDYSLKLTAYRKAVELNPTNSKYHQSLAWTYGILDDYKLKAIGEFELAVSLEPNNAYRHRTYAIWLLNHPTEEDIEKGVAEYRKAIELKPNLAEEALTKYYKYQKDYERLIDIFPGTEESDYTMFLFLTKEKGLKSAIDFAEEFLKTYPHNAKMHFCIADGSFYDENYPWEFTEKHYKIAFENDPENAYYRMWRGIHLYIRREYKKALKVLEMAISMGLGLSSEKQAREVIAKCKMQIQ